MSLKRWVEWYHQHGASFNSISALRLRLSPPAVAILRDVPMLEELTLDMEDGDEFEYFASPSLRHSLPGPLLSDQLLRLCIHHVDLISKMRPFNLPLTRLRCLRICPSPEPAVLRAGTAYHQGCGPGTATPSDNEPDLFSIDFSCLPALTELELGDICNHVPIMHLVSPTLRALLLLSNSRNLATLRSRAQRTPADLVLMAQIAPSIRRLELDIGSITNLWHSTSIPGVNVDVELYSFLATLSHFKALHTLTLFPPYFEKSIGATQRGLTFVEERQPTTDPDAVAMFDRLRFQIPTLHTLSIVSSTHVFSTTNHALVHNPAPTHASTGDFHDMRWHMTRWGDKTILLTRQATRNYAQRQIWVGQRRLTTSILRDKYASSNDCTIRGCMDQDSGWILG